MSRLFDYTLALADDALISAQRMGWWISRAPQLEEDVALANIGLDQLGQARTLLAYAGEVEGAGRDEDDLAYFRDERDFRNVHLVERDQSDFGVAMARLLLFSRLAVRALRRAPLQHRRDPGRRRRQGGQGGGLPPRPRPPAGCSGSATAPRSPTTRMQAALDAEWPYLAELFDGSADRPRAASTRASRSTPPPCARPCWPGSSRS